MIKLTQRQQKILEFIRNNPNSSNSDINKDIRDVSRFTIVRDLNLLVKEELINRIGQGRSVVYIENIRTPLLTHFDVDHYFKYGPDERNILYKKFNFDIFNNLQNIFTEEEINKLAKLNKRYQDNIKKLSPIAIKKEFERLIIELSWKSSQIEGNTYTLIDTEILLKENEEKSGHKKEEAIMLLNHKKAFDYILSNKKRFKRLDLRDIEDIHELIIQGLGVKRGIRKRIVRITGTAYKPLDNQHQIKEALEKMVEALNQMKDPISKAFLVILMISYIQPFEDGNKRTARLMANAVLIANNACPLSFRSINVADYKKAVILFYEQNSARFFKELFIDQFEFAVNNYFEA